VKLAPLLCRRIDVAARKLLITSPDGAEELLGYDKLIVGTGAVPVRPSIGGLAGPDALGAADWGAPAALDGRQVRRHAHPGNRRAAPCLFACRHLLACGEPTEDVQHGGQPGVRTRQAIRNGAQGLRLWFGEAHHHVQGWGMSSADSGCMSLVKTVLGGWCRGGSGWGQP